jgi:hypothetical protein
VVGTVGVTLWVPLGNVESVVEPSVKVMVTAPDVVQVRSKESPAPGAEVRLHVGAGGTGDGGKVTAVEQVPDAFVATSV